MAAAGYVHHAQWGDHGSSALRFEDSEMTTRSDSSDSSSPSNDLRFIIMGAGMSGILSAIKLQEAGLDNYAIYEKADRLGGTWRENEYAGIACDVPSHMYSYSFAPNAEWSHRHSPGAEIQAYFEDVAHQYKVDSRIQYGKEITRCEFDDGRWKVEMGDGSTDEADFLIAATGVLHHPSYPDIEGQRTLGSRHAARGQAHRCHRDRLDRDPDHDGVGRQGRKIFSLPTHTAMGHAGRESDLYRSGEGRVS